MHSIQKVLVSEISICSVRINAACYKLTMLGGHCCYTIANERQLYCTAESLQQMISPYRTLTSTILLQEKMVY